MRPYLSLSYRQTALVVTLACVLLGLSLPQGPRADPGHVRDAPAIHEEFDGFADPGFRVLPLREAVQIAHQRFRGKLIAARLKPPSPQERARGVELVHELKLLTEARDVLRIRLDARTGAFLEVAGSGLTKARRRNGDHE